jgi:hypothetical protein
MGQAYDLPGSISDVGVRGERADDVEDVLRAGAYGQANLLVAVYLFTKLHPMN